MNNYSCQNKIQRKSNLKLLIQGVMLFFFFFDASLLNLPTIMSSRKIVFISLVLKNIISKKENDLEGSKYNDIMRTLKKVMIFVTAYLLFLTIVNNLFSAGYSTLPRLSFFLLYTIFGSVLVLKEFENLEQLLKCIVIAMLIQSTIVILQFSFPIVREFLFETFRSSGHISFLRTGRAAGLGMEGATLSLMFFVGIFSCAYLLLFVKFHLGWCLSLLYFLMAAFFVGRTGLYVSVIFILFFLLIMLFKKKSGTLFKIILSLSFSITILSFYLPNIIDMDRIDKVSIWAAEIFDYEKEETTLTSLQNMPIPPLTIETFFGTGVHRGYTRSGLFLQNDSGYIQLYSSLGLAVSILFYSTLYVSIFILIHKITNHEIKLFLYFYLFTMMIVEYKEPFILKQIFPLVLLLIIGMVYKDKKLV